MAKTKVDIISGFLGAGKTTFIKKLLAEALSGEKVVLIENEFGEIGIDGGFLKDSGIEVREMNSGCICCSLVGDFASSLKEILTKYTPDRVIIEPSGVGKLSDVMRAVADVEEELPVAGNSAVTLVDVKKAKLYIKNFGEFFNNQVQYAKTIVLSRTDVADQKKIDEAIQLIREINKDATIITTPLADLTGEKLLEILEHPVDLKAELFEELAEEHEHHHHHDEDGHCCCGHDHHHHHHGHDADEVFDSVGLENVPAFTEDKLHALLLRLAESEEFGKVVRAKGMVPSADGGAWLHFDLVPGETEIRRGAAEASGKVCVIGSELKEEAITREFKA